MTELRNKHTLNKKNAGISIRKGNVCEDITTEKLDDKFTGII